MFLWAGHDITIGLISYDVQRAVGKHRAGLGDRVGMGIELAWGWSWHGDRVGMGMEWAWG